ncbi:MAG TPA: hypothetical protein VNC50_08340, partial [Planctomycetia bacterium]|nr:hypothetical protein [Planctomycetia bacterium]
RRRGRPNCGNLGLGHGGCSKCGGSIHNWNGFGGRGVGGYGTGAQGAPYYSAYPGMNREDALRYVEGFQYYPPTQIVRSPRDFFMFDVRYGVGK